jgi:hypothetical protein
LQRIIPDYKIENKIITIDLETRTIDKIMETYYLSIYDGKQISSFYLNDYNTSEEMLISAIKSIMIKKYDKYKIYLHNFMTPLHSCTCASTVSVSG